jgi:hypothetical protein
MQCVFLQVCAMFVLVSNKNNAFICKITRNIYDIY